MIEGGASVFLQSVQDPLLLVFIPLSRQRTGLAECLLSLQLQQAVDFFPGLLSRLLISASPIPVLLW